MSITDMLGDVAEDILGDVAEDILGDVAEYIINISEVEKNVK